VAEVFAYKPDRYRIPMSTVHYRNRISYRYACIREKDEKQMKNRKDITEGQQMHYKGSGCRGMSSAAFCAQGA